ncbi:MAG: hypothetical protein O9256_00800 [Rhizobiaceae bacterium]|nr:hypothetical protein [Rhizobiaceae bacterium]
MTKRKLTVADPNGRMKPGVVPHLKGRTNDRWVHEAEPAVGIAVNRDAFTRLAEETAGGVRDTLAELLEVEARMARVAMLLRYAQPARSGRLTVRWWKMRGRDQWREPVLLRVETDAKGREFYKPVDRRAKIRANSSWGATSEQAEVALRVWWVLQARREEVLGRLRSARRTFGPETPAAGDWRNTELEVEDAIESALRIVAESRLFASSPGVGRTGSPHTSR